MGRDKALLDWNGETLIELALRKLGAVCGDVAIAGGSPELARFGRVIADPTPGLGPLSGIVAALEQSSFERNLFLAVDMPFVPDAVLLSLVAGSGAEMVLLARADGYLQPLCGVYSRRALPALRAELMAGRLKLKDAALATGSVAYVDFDELDWFRNLNTPDEFRAAVSSIR